MPMPGAFDPAEDVKIHWVEVKVADGHDATKVLEDERSKPPAGRADVFAIDLHTTGVGSALGWAKHFLAGRGPQDPPVCLVAYGREIEPEEQQQFALAGIHAIDVFRKDLGLQGPSHAMLVNLVRSVVLAQPVAAAKPALSQPGPSPGDWQAFSTQPSHVPASALIGLFEELASDDQAWWERDS